MSLTVIVAERSINESGRWVKEDAEVEGGQVIGLDAVVLDGHVAVVVGPGVYVPAAVGRVQHVREACLLQAVAVQRRRPGCEGKRLVGCAEPWPGSGGKSGAAHGFPLSIPASKIRPSR